MPPPAATEAAARYEPTPTPRIPNKCRVHDPASCLDAVHTRACTGIKKRS